MSETPDLRQAARYFARLVRLIRPYWLDLAQGFVVALLLGLVGMVAPYITKLLVDRVYPERDVSLMHALVLGLLAFQIASTALGLLSGTFTLYVNTRLNHSTRLLFFNHLQHLPARWFDRHQVGEINSRFQDLGRSLESIGRVFQIVFVQGAYLLLVPPILVLLDWRLALVALITVPLSVGVTAWSGSFLRRRWQRVSRSFADLNAFQIESLTHIRTFKTMALERHVYRRADGLVHHAMDEQVRAGALSQGFGAINGVFRALNTAVFTWFGWTLILRGSMSLGEFLAFSAYVGFLYGPIQQLIQLVSDFQQSAVHLHRTFEYLDEVPEQDPWRAIAPEPRASDLAETRSPPAIRFDRVDFAYETERPVLSEIDLTLAAGSTTAIVGASGSGKTSLLRLLTRIEEPTSGTISWDGRPLESLPLDVLRGQLAVVWQEIALVRGSLRENVALGALGTLHPPDDRAIRDALELAGLGELLRERSEGLDAPIAEWGSTLSAGQRQRVALARALLRTERAASPLLVLDEATANVDVETERRVLGDLFARLAQRATIVFVTHRLATAHLAERIVVLDRGRLAGVGRPEGLLETCAPYRRLAEAAGAERSGR